MLTFVGEGYNPAFTANYRRLAERLSAGEEIEIVHGPDDICAPLLADAEAHCFRESVGLRDKAAALDVSALLGIAIVEGLVIRPDAAFLAKLREGFSKHSVRGACSGCEWSTLCDRIAGVGFDGVLVGSARPIRPERAIGTSARRME
ncbi:2Fe-2S ferredoxin [Rhizobium sp. LCM 4573]|nr:2Fe-2S ferredoxin [Rhizobium sp. LCM 4573]